MPGIGRSIIGGAVIGALTALAAPGPAAAQPGAGPDAGRASPARMFRQADSDGDGRVTEAEGWAWLSDRIVLIDINRDGGLSLEEWRTVWSPDGRPSSRVRPDQQRAEGFFRGVDIDRDGRVTPAELRPFAEALFRSFDADGDRVLTATEVSPSPPTRAERQGASRDRDPARSRGAARDGGAGPEAGLPKD